MQGSKPNPNPDFVCHSKNPFLIAYLANHHGVTFKTAQGYAKDVDNEIGGLWLFLANLAVKSINNEMSDNFQKIIENITKDGNITELNQID